MSSAEHYKWLYLIKKQPAHFFSSLFTQDTSSQLALFNRMLQATLTQIIE
ncbi:hypothetical protein MED121_13750 [Marinomonas sp. MED121]|nr:hypothetical protein MED121_13750 [Marinomonas sp. MED121]